MSLGYYDLWPAALLVLGCVALASLPWFRPLDADWSEHPGQRWVPIDGLRALLALAVFVHHLAIRRAAVASGVVELPPSPFYALLGSLGVGLFFMITGFLFWERMLRAGGRLAWRRLYLNRLVRIAPLYWVVVAGYVVATLCTVPDRGAAAPGELAWQLVRWLAVGAYPYPPPLLGETRTLPIVGMTWSLAYEWAFYASLPLLAPLAPPARAGRAVTAILVALVALVLLGLASQRTSPFLVALFLCGMFWAQVLHARPQWRGDGPWRSAAALALLLAAALWCRTAYSAAGLLLLGAFFGLVAAGSSVFGVLGLRGVQRLGHASYSLYLLHGLVLWTLFSPAVLGRVATASPPAFWGVAILSAAVLVGVSRLGYCWIERPPMRWLRARSQRLGDRA